MCKTCIDEVRVQPLCSECTHSFMAIPLFTSLAYTARGTRASRTWARYTQKGHTRIYYYIFSERDTGLYPYITITTTRVSRSASASASGANLHRTRERREVSWACDSRLRAWRETPVVVARTCMRVRARRCCRSDHDDDSDDVRPGTSILTHRSRSHGSQQVTPLRGKNALVYLHSGHVTQTELDLAPSHCTTLHRVTSPWRERSEAR